MEQYQEVDFYLSESKGWILGEIRNQDGDIIREADKPIPSDCIYQTMEKTFKPDTTSKIDSVCIKNIWREGSSDEIMQKIKDLKNKHLASKPYVPYILDTW